MAECDFKEEFLKKYPDFILKETVSYDNGGYSYFFCDGKTVIIIDINICQGDIVFPYSLLTNKQNYYFDKYDHVYRFLGFDWEKIEYYLKKETIEFCCEEEKHIDRANNIDVSPLEFLFENNFSNVYGKDSIKYLQKEHLIVNEEGKYYFIDYYLESKDGDFGVEENGVKYHHPQNIKEEKYKIQLDKQNTCSLLNIKLFRFSTEDCRFSGRTEDDIRRYFGDDINNFVENGIIAERKVKLYDHQELTLEEIEKQRNDGAKAFLVVSPTATGKSKIVEEDLLNLYKKDKNMKVLILAPTVRVVLDWKDRIRNSLGNIYADVFTYSSIVRNFPKYDPEYYDYIVVDEAHHAVAPMLKRTIQYFRPKFLIGLTATDKRLDNKKLESVFGGYNTQLSLKDAMEKGVIARANVYRIETDINLSKVRFNGKDYINADLENLISVSTRNDTIAKVLKEYFCSEETKDYQGAVFCVNTEHTKKMAKLLNEYGISASDYTRETKHPDEVMERFKQHEIRFLCACNMISEGWDYPELRIIVMARPTLSRVLYLQQVGRGLRKTSTKKNVFIIDVVDEYGSMAKACNMHTIFSNPYYSPFGDIIKPYKLGDLIEVDGICEKVERIIPVDIETFESKYGDYLSIEQLAREYFVSTGTITSWIKTNKIIPTVEYMFGSKKQYLFSPEDVEKIRDDLQIPVHNDETIKKDFFDFLEERDYSLSYKMPFLIGCIDHMDPFGNIQISDVLDDYIAFYQDRISKGLVVDRKTCPYNSKTLKDRKMIKESMLTNPFEKFERKRFMYYSKDLNVISINHSLIEKMTTDDWKTVKNQMINDLQNYYDKLEPQE